MWVKVPALNIVVSVASSTCPATESRRARVARVAGLQRNGAFVVASPLRPDEAEALLLREMQDLGGHDHDREAILDGIQQHWEDFMKDFFGQVAAGVTPPA